MPIRRELRHLYRTPEWAAARARVLERARGRCEQCGRPEGLAFTYTWQSFVIGRPPMKRVKLYHMIWVASGGNCWRDQLGRGVVGPTWPHRGLPRQIFVRLAVCHVDPAGEFLDLNNLRAWCAWCHLHHDQPQHHETRAARRDKSRPLLGDLPYDTQRPDSLG